MKTAYTKMVIAHGKLLLKSDKDHSIPAIITRIRLMLSACGHTEENYQNVTAENALYAYRDSLKGL